MDEDSNPLNLPPDWLPNPRMTFAEFKQLSSKAKQTAGTCFAAQLRQVGPEDLVRWTTLLLPAFSQSKMRARRGNHKL
jgi:hypothetical protein